MSNTRSFKASLFALSAAFGLSVGLVGCGRDAPPSVETAGDLQLALQVAGATINAASYSITGPGTYSKMGTVDVAQSATISATIGGIPAGMGTIALNATSTDGSVSCAGSAPFTIVAHTTAPVTVALTCHEAAKTGTIMVSGVLNNCPLIDGLSASPSSVNVGGSIALGATAHDSDLAPSALTYQWTVTGPATLSSATGAAPTLTCTAAGTATAQVTVSDGDPAAGCADVQTVAVSCTALGCAGGCDDNNPCTTDTCTPAQTCTHTTVPDGTLCSGGNLKVKLLGFNDFHGQLSTGKLVSSRPVGSAGVFASYLKAAQAGIESQTLIVHAGDHVGASPAASALLQDEPSIQFLNMLANGSCSYTNKLDPACNLVGTLGNHEFDEGRTELLRLLNGGNHPSGPFLEDPYRGARFPYVSANVVDQVTRQPILLPYVIKKIQGVPIAFVGAVLEATPTIVTPTGVASLSFLDEADAANSYVPEIKAMGVKTIVLLIHQGSSQSSYTGPTNTALTNTALGTSTDVVDVVTRLDSEFDVVVSGHSHSFTNVFITNNAGKKILVTQAFSASTAYDDIDLLINPVTKDVVSSTAKVVTTFADVAPGNMPDAAAVALTTMAETRVAPLVSQVVGFSPQTFTATQNAAGESALGDIIADAQRASMSTQLAFMNPGGIRADLTVPMGGANITWGQLFTIQPFGNTMVKVNMTGAQVKALLEQQWMPTVTRFLQISGLTYTWDAALPVGGRITDVRDAATNTAIDPLATYTVTCNNFLATGGDGFSVFTLGTGQVGGPVDLDALIDYTQHHNPLSAPTLGRITKLH